MQPPFPLLHYYRHLLGVGAVLLGCQIPLNVCAAPRVPAQDSEVLERLPLRAVDPTARELADLRAAVNNAAKIDPTDPSAATLLAQRYFDLALSRGDPRYVGYADAAIQPFAQSNSAPLLVMRGQLLQYRHGFDAALQNFAAALQADPQFALAHAWRGAIFLVQADYVAAQKECDALQRLGRTTLTGACVGLLKAYTGQMSGAEDVLQAALKQSPSTENRLWLLTRLGEVAAWRGHPERAEKYYREALALDLDDGYLLAAWADFLLDQNRPADVVKWLAKWESSDGLLLRLALAETVLKQSAAAAHVQALDDRFAAAKQRGDTTHRAEEARFQLALKGNPQLAVQLASANYQIQREPRDARVLLQAALAAKDSKAAKPVQDWLQSSGFEGLQLRQLGQLVSSPQGVTP
jgi:tetratricopeptide (TPR) repeat protein